MAIGSREDARVRLLLVVASALVMTAGCSGKNAYDPGEKVGTFHVTATLTKTTCGQPPTPWEFDVHINHDGSTFYWIQGGAPIAGEVDHSARAKLASSVVQEVRPADAKTKTSACALQRSDALDVVLSDADAKPVTDPGAAKSFAGYLSYSFAPTTGSECNDQLTDSGGGYEALPCSVSYSVAGKLTKPAATP